VLKFATGSLTDLVKHPNSFMAVSALTDNSAATFTRLRALVSDITARAAPGQPNATYYSQLEANLTDANWEGVMVFNAAVEPPAQVQGTPTPVPDVVGFSVLQTAPGSPAESSLFAAVNWPGSSTTPAGQYLFQSNALTGYAASASPPGDVH
jgi:hypothetical protein